MAAIKFGTAFRYREKDFVFLAKTENIVYAAQILDEELTHEVKKMYERVEKRRRDAHQELLYCFVELRTEEFAERAAHFANTGKEEFGFLPQPSKSLIYEDLVEIKREVLDGPVPIELKKLVRSIDLSGSHG